MMEILHDAVRLVAVVGVAIILFYAACIAFVAVVCAAGSILGGVIAAMPWNLPARKDNRRGGQRWQ